MDRLTSNIVPPDGPLDAKILFVGEAPGEEEDELGALDFVGLTDDIGETDGQQDIITPTPEVLEDDLIQKLPLMAGKIQGTEIIIMGRSTYEELLKFDMEWPYENFKTYVVTSNPAFEIKTASTYLLTSPISSLITNWKQTAKIGRAHV